MRFSFSDDHLALQGAVRELLLRECTPEVVRAAWPIPVEDDQGPGAGARSDNARIEALWHQLGEMGVLGLLVPESAGGMGFDEVAAVAMLAEVGYFAVPHPVVEAMCVIAPAQGNPFPTRRDVAWGAESLRGDSVDGALNDFGCSGEITPHAFDRAALGTAAMLIGLGRRMLDLTVAYVSERNQFGVPIGTFQAVKHHLADARLQLEFAAPAVWRAAWSLATSQDSAVRDVSMAKAMASDAAHLVGRKALQCHGGIGYTVEYDLHLFLKRAWALERLWGDRTWHLARVSSAIGVS